MKLIVLVTSLALAYARPDISLVPSGSYLPGVGGSNGLNGGSLISSGISGLGSLNGGSLSVASLGDGLNGDLGGGLGGGVVSGLGGGFGGSFGGALGGGLIGTGGLAHEHKQVHFYAAPEELQAPLRIYVTPNSQRNTRVLFVKAPSYGALRPEVIAPTSVTEDRTKVYVLVKRPESGGSITIPTNIATRPTKPELYFINYKTEQEAQQALAGGLQEEAVGPTAPELGNAQSFINTLKTDISSGFGGGHGGAGGIVSLGGAGGIATLGGAGGIVTLGGVGGIAGGIGGVDISGSNVLGGATGGHLGGIAGGSAGHGPIGASGPY